MAVELLREPMRGQLKTITIYRAGLWDSRIFTSKTLLVLKAMGNETEVEVWAGLGRLGPNEQYFMQLFRIVFNSD